MTQLRGYQQSIADAIGITDPAIIAKVEVHMRSDIFHGTLDWQTKRQFNDGARKALRLYSAMNPDALDDATFAKVWRVKNTAEVYLWRADFRAELEKINKEITA